MRRNFSASNNSDALNQGQAKRATQSHEGKEEKRIISEIPESMGSFKHLPTVLHKNMSQFLSTKDVANLKLSNSLMREPQIHQELKCNAKCQPVKPDGPHDPLLTGDCSNVCYRLAQERITQLLQVLLDSNPNCRIQYLNNNEKKIWVFDNAADEYKEHNPLNLTLIMNKTLHDSSFYSNYFKIDWIIIPEKTKTEIKTVKVSKKVEIEPIEFIQSFFLGIKGIENLNLEFPSFFLEILTSLFKQVPNLNVDRHPFGFAHKILIKNTLSDQPRPALRVAVDFYLQEKNNNGIDSFYSGEMERLSKTNTIKLILAFRKPAGPSHIVNFYPTVNTNTIFTIRSIKNWWNINLFGYNTTKMIIDPNNPNANFDADINDKHPYNGRPLSIEEENERNEDSKDYDYKEGKSREGPGLASSLRSLLNQNQRAFYRKKKPTKKPTKKPSKTPTKTPTQKRTTTKRGTSKLTKTKSTTKKLNTKPKTKAKAKATEKTKAQTKAQTKTKAKARARAKAKTKGRAK
jgi:hypothetical protein